MDAQAWILIVASLACGGWGGVVLYWAACDVITPARFRWQFWDRVLFGVLVFVGVACLLTGAAGLSVLMVVPWVVL